MRTALRVVCGLALALCAAGYPASHARAEVRLHIGVGDAQPSIIVTGRIDLFTLYSFVRVMGDPRLHGIKQPLVKLDSEGGSVTAAMAVGRIIRDQGYATEVPRGSECLSACVLIFAAGSERFLSTARVGVHRPRADLALMAPWTERERKASYDEITDAMREYLRAMGMSDELFQAMLRVPSHRMRMLTRGEIHAFGLLTGAPAATAPATPRIDARRRRVVVAAAAVRAASTGVGSKRVRRSAVQRRSAPNVRRLRRSDSRMAVRSKRAKRTAEIRTQVNVNVHAKLGTFMLHG